MLIIYALPLLMIALLLFSGWLIPVITPSTLPFGVRVPPSHTTEPIISRVTRDYRLGLFFSAGCAGILFWLLNDPAQFLTLILAETFGMLVLLTINYLIAHYRLRDAKQQGNWYAGLRQVLVADTAPRPQAPRLSRFWLVANFVSLAPIILLTFVRYPSLPEIIPTHFGLNGQPDAWGPKFPMAIFLPALTVFLTLLMVGIANGMRTMHGRIDPTAPEISRLRELHHQKIWGGFLLQMAVAINLLMFVTSLPTMLLVPSSDTFFGLTILLFLGLILGMLGWCILQTVRSTRQIEAEQQELGYVPRDDDRFWPGGLIYINRDDPSIFVPKRIGIGTTVNFGHPMGLLMMVLLIGGPILLTLVIVILTTN